MRRKIIFLLMLIFVMIASLNTYTSHSQAQYEELLRNVEIKLITEYHLVNTLNDYSTDVSYYTNLLNKCLELIDNAKTYNYIKGDENAINILESVISVLNAIDNDIKATLIEYYSNSYSLYLQKLTIPIVATIIIVMSTIIFWIIFKNYYYAKLLEMKAEVDTNEIK
jgi:hypothetical protein